MQVKNKIANAKHRVSPLELGRRITELRRGLGIQQGQLAKAVEKSQAVVSQWETGTRNPGAIALSIIARLAPESDRDWWLEQAGLALEDVTTGLKRDAAETLGASRPPVPVQLLKDSAAAGSGRFIQEKDVEDVLLLPATWVPHPEGTKCIKISGDSMSPVLEDGYVVAIDTTLRDPKKLVNEMVAARDPEGAVTVKWLRYPKQKHYLLVAQHTSVDYDPIIVSEESGWEIIGCVLWWIGKPPKKKRGRK